MIRLILCLVLACAALQAQQGAETVVASLSPLPKIVVQRAFSKRAAKALMVYVVAIENEGTGPVAVGESAIIRRVPQILPMSSKAAALLVAEAAQNSPWARAGRLVQDMMFTALYLQTSGVVALGQTATAALAAAGSLGPHAVDRIQGAAPPITQNFGELEWRDVVRLEPGQSATMFLFATPIDKPVPVSITIDVSRTASVKLAQ